MAPLVRRLQVSVAMLLLAIGLIVPPAAAGEVGDVRFLVTASWLAQLGDDSQVVVVDLRPATAYAEGHIPGAVNLPVQTLAQPGSDEDQVGPWQARVGALLGDLGITPSHIVVGYDENGNLFGSRLRWVLKHLGHDNALVLDGGLAAWTSLGRPLESEPAVRQSAVYEGVPDHGRMVTWSQVLDRLSSPDVQIVDVRPAAVYAEGHIPTARNLDWNNNVKAEAPRTFKSLAELQPLYDSLGLDRSKEIIVYCTTGIQASNTLLVLEMLGYPNIRLYSGSWSEWSNRADLPKATGPEPGLAPG